MHGRMPCLRGDGRRYSRRTTNWIALANTMVTPFAAVGQVTQEGGGGVTAAAINFTYSTLSRYDETLEAGLGGDLFIGRMVGAETVLLWWGVGGHYSRFAIDNSGPETVEKLHLFGGYLAIRPMFPVFDREARTIGDALMGFVFMELRAGGVYGRRDFSFLDFRNTTDAFSWQAGIALGF